MTREFQRLAPVVAALTLLVNGARADDEPFGQPRPGPVEAAPDTSVPTDRSRLEDALFGGDEDGDAEGAAIPDAPSPTPRIDPSDTGFDPLSIGGQLYLRLNTAFTDRGRLGEQMISMPNLVDVYLDARPEERVRGFIQGRLRFDPTVIDGSRNLFGQETRQASVLLDVDRKSVV